MIIDEEGESHKFKVCGRVSFLVFLFFRLAKDLSEEGANYLFYFLMPVLRREGGKSIFFGGSLYRADP